MCWCLVVFFFKQKTAYEMRISDWSSDVCSSDLQSDAVAHHRTTSPRTIVDAGRNCQATRVGIRHDRSSRRWPLWERIDGKATSQNGRPGMAAHPDPGARQIGRASCRERVCQYV